MFSASPSTAPFELTSCQFDDLALPLNIEFNFEISCRSMVDGFPEFEQRLDLCSAKI